MSNFFKAPPAYNLGTINQMLDDMIRETDKDAEKTLRNQSEILDLVFRHLLAEAAHSYGPLDFVGPALQSQNQYRSTIKMLKAFEKETKGRTQPVQS